ncbi:SOS response-associated peptidase family protein [Sorangium sp. So ce1036]|uniref:SOS response-associated peptidase n=1 Tax=Sorangium sp. So ce1036 TaxID=3133328 RepID=UPI003EFFE3A8
MCARFTLAVPDLAALIRLLEGAFGASAGPAAAIDVDPRAAAFYRPRYNIAPSSVHPVLRARDGRRELVPATWGFTARFARGGAGPSLLANARAESARTKPTFRDAFAARRCVIPADGFYEWTGPRGARRPTWFHPAGGGLLRLAGLYQPAKDPDAGDTGVRFTILTTDASGDVAEVHDRMPVLLAPGDVDLWLGAGGGVDPEQIEALLRPAPRGTLAARAVSPRVNSVAHDGPDLLREVAMGSLAPEAAAGSPAPEAAAGSPAPEAASSRGAAPRASAPGKAAAPRAGGTLPLFDLDGGAGPAVPSGRTPRH